MDRLKKLLPKWLVIFLITTLLGVVFIAIYYSSSSPKGVIIEIIGTVGKTILGSGVFLVLLKSLQFLGVFQDEIRKIVYSDEILAKRNDIQDIWKKVTRALYQSAFPLISNKLEDLIQNKILPRRLNYYHKNLYVIYEINKVDNDHFELIESQSFTIVSDGESFNFELMNDFTKTNQEADRSSFKIKELVIDGTDYANKVIEVEPIEIEDNQIQLNFNCSINLKGSKEYNVRKVIHTIHTNKLNGFWKYEIGRLTDSFTLDIRNPDNYEMDLIPIGSNTNLKRIFISSTLNLKKHSDLMMPGDGFVIIIKPRVR